MTVTLSLTAEQAELLEDALRERCDRLDEIEASPDIAYDADDRARAAADREQLYELLLLLRGDAR